MFTKSGFPVDLEELADRAAQAVLQEKVCVKELPAGPRRKLAAHGRFADSHHSNQYPAVIHKRRKWPRRNRGHFLYTRRLLRVARALVLIDDVRSDEDQELAVVL